MSGQSECHGASSNNGNEGSSHVRFLTSIDGPTSTKVSGLHG
nr:hypothetical protein [Borreliella bavariensis]